VTRLDESDDALAVLACEIDKRPAGAPAFTDLLPFVRRRTRETGWLIIGFDPEAAATVSAFVDAERRCCAGIGWEVGQADLITVRITAAPSQLDVLEQMWHLEAGA
jgi:hypothetical protein